MCVKVVDIIINQPNQRNGLGATTAGGGGILPASIYLMELA